MGKTRPLTEAKISNEHNDKEERWRKLLQPYKVIKDPVHKDIWLTETEVRIIDTPEFQRLRYIRQLGPAHLIYPGAKHTRFDHCIGTVHVVQKIINSIQRNSKIYNNAVELTYRETFLARLTALLHDAAHLPFGHLIEDEGKILKEKQWRDEFRVNKLLGKGSNIRDVIEESLKNNKIDKGEIEKLINELIEVLKYEEGNSENDKKYKKGFEKRYIADIVGNTICADLLDYVKRDVYFTGIFGQFDERLFAYFTLLKDKKEGKKELVIELSKPKDNKPRYDVISAIIDLMHLRYSIAEKVYFHHTRQKLSAMIIEMVEAAFKAGILDKEKLFDFNDDYLLKFIVDYLNNASETEIKKLKSENKMKYLEIAILMARSILNRELYDEVFRVERWQYDYNTETKNKIDTIIESWEYRFDFERFIEERLNLPPGSIIIYAPAPKMGAKREIQTKVEFQGSIYPLNEIPTINPQFDFIKKDVELTKVKHENLWNFKLLCSKEVKSEKRDRIKGICGEIFIQNVIGDDTLSLLRDFDPENRAIYKEAMERVIATEGIPPTSRRGVECFLRRWVTAAESHLNKK